MPFPVRLKYNFIANYANLYAPMNGSLIKPIFRVNFDCATGIEPFIGQGPATYTCASTAQYSAVCFDDLGGDPIGTIKTAAIDQPRIEKDGLLLEGASENLFLNSQAPVTQSIILAAGTYAISVVGTGSISTSYGSATESSDLTFTTVGETLLFTVVGALDTAQVEKLPFSTSIIYTEASPVTRAATNLTYPVPAGFDPALFSIECEFDLNGINTVDQIITAIANVGLTEYVMLSVDNTGHIVAELTSTLTDTLTSTTGVLPNVRYKAKVVFDGVFLDLLVNDVLESTTAVTASALTAMDKVYAGSINNTLNMFGHLSSLKINNYDILGDLTSVLLPQTYLTPNTEMGAYL